MQIKVAVVVLHWKAMAHRVILENPGRRLIEHWGCATVKRPELLRHGTTCPHASLPQSVPLILATNCKQHQADQHTMTDFRPESTKTTAQFAGMLTNWGQCASAKLNSHHAMQ